MEVGLRGPCNLFGHASIQGLAELDKELSQCDNNHQDKVTKLVFGHFPTSFIASTEDGERPEEIFAKHNIMAYLCGHLHFQFGRNLFKHHFRSLSKGIREFWEWELGDWKESQVMRIIAIDHGHASFLDLDVIDLEESSVHDNSKAFILITYPLDSRKMQRQVSTPNTIVEDSVRALVFSQMPVVSAKALVYDSHWDSGNPVEDLTLEQMFVGHNSVWYFVAPMNFSNYLDASPARFSLKIMAIDSSGKQIVSDLRVFSANGYLGRLKWTWKEFFVMGIVWDALFPPLLWTAFCILVLILIVPKLCIYLVLDKGLNLGLLLCKKSSASWTLLSEMLVAGDKASGTLWWMQLFLLVYLVYMPWFWGRVLGESCPLGSMSVRGWSLDTTGFSDSKWAVGVPDVMVIVLPFLYHILLPLFVLVFALFSEQAGAQIHLRRGSNRSSEKRSMGLKKPTELDFSCRLCKRWVRKALLVACLGVAYLHAKHTWAIVGAYGMEAMLISPGFAWPVPVLLVAAVLQTSSVES